MPLERNQATTFRHMALLATVVGVGVTAVVNLAVDHTDPAVVVARQQERLAELDRQAEALAVADDFDAAAQARRRLGRTVGAFDRTLAALMSGGLATDEDGQPLRIAAVAAGDAHLALERVSVLWLRLGPPLADLATGAYAVHGVAGRQALAQLHAHGSSVAAELATANAALADWRPPTSWAAVAAGFIAAGVVLLVIGAWGGAGSGRRQEAALPDLVPGPLPSRDTAVAGNRAQATDTVAAVNRLALGIAPQAAPERRQVTSRAPLAAFRDHLAREGGAATNGGGTLLLHRAGHAASYATLVATELAACAREAAKLTDRVAQISRWTGEAADQLGAESLQDGPADAGAAETAAHQVSELSARTAATAAEIEQTVSVLLCRTREYEEAVGRILGHISAIHRGTQRLGRVLGAATPSSPAPSPPEPAAARARIPVEAGQDPAPPPVIRQFPVPPGDEEPEPTAAQVADETAAAIAEMFGAEDPSGPPAAAEQGADPAAPQDPDDGAAAAPPADRPR